MTPAAPPTSASVLAAVAPPLRIGILGAARIAPAALIKPAARTGRADQSPPSPPATRPRPSAFAQKHKIPRVARLLRGRPGRPRHRRRLHPAPQRPARPLDHRGARGRQARAVREALHGQRRRGPGRGRGRRRPPRPGRHGGLPLPVPPADPAPGRDRPVRRARHHHRASTSTSRRPWPSRATSATSSTWPAGPPWTWAAIPISLLRLLAAGPPGHQRRGQALLPGRRPRHGCPLLAPRRRHRPHPLLHVLASLLRLHAEVTGTEGTLSVFNPFAPQFGHRVRVTTASGTRKERFSRRATYDYQLEAFVAAVERRAPRSPPPPSTPSGPWSSSTPSMSPPASRCANRPPPEVPDRGAPPPRRPRRA